jgi:hypothetical protein
MIWRQFGASLDMLANAVESCPDELWGDAAKSPQFWYLAYHTLFFVDLYLTGTLDGFTPPAPFTMSEVEPEGRIPDAYTKQELNAYIRHCRQKGKRVVMEMTSEMAMQKCRFRWLEIEFGELQIYSVRHVQHHAAQLNLILRQQTNSAPDWVSFCS